MSNISNDERREVAAKLRDKHRERTMPGMFEPQDVNMQLHTYIKDLESCLPDGDSMFTVLADLIEPEHEKTCEMELVKRGPIYDVWKCTECGEEFPENRTDSGAWCFEPNYCPMCRTKVVWR